ncbi:Frataxin [Suhomyces tanzawaensis NRRL Y-17324]|uniref:ferroxidase n=1 Tax=Suhomyces tanzawaensis NRRL Y-17324 TaxID=984487 RepID=A0A1E4SBP5_9ASCO|nr:Frataxin [Suhomyces tanzawaensis NRRL Y-17324]ODV76886.1 Frataxin [Suhomyces tanzawaensis NRRL Y-17324]
MSFRQIVTAASRCRALARGAPARSIVAAVGSRQFGLRVQHIATRNYSVTTEGENISDKIDQLTPNQYSTVADHYLEAMADSLEELSEDHPEVDCELSQGVMTLTIPANGTYVINKQPPNKQIWLSSPISGPKRYDLIQGKWITLRDNTSLTELLEREVGEALGQTVELGLEQ